jgi:general L-amino acid transport system substrate-binding protein
MVRHGDDQWFDIAQWTVFAMIAAEEFDITSANVDSVMLQRHRSEVRRLLGTRRRHGTETRSEQRLGL